MSFLVKAAGWSWADVSFTSGSHRSWWVFAFVNHEFIDATGMAHSELKLADFLLYFIWEGSGGFHKGIINFLVDGFLGTGEGSASWGFLSIFGLVDFGKIEVALVSFKGIFDDEVLLEGGVVVEGDFAGARHE